MESEEEVVVDEPRVSDEEIEPFCWEDRLYETWLEEKMEKERRKLGEAGV